MLGWTHECQTVMSVANKCSPHQVAFTCEDCRTALCASCAQAVDLHCMRCPKLLEPLEQFLARFHASRK